MGLLFAIIIGALIGIFGSVPLQKNFDLLLINALVGTSGAILGLAFTFFIFPGQDLLLFSWSALIVEAIVATIAVIIFSTLHKIASKKESFETSAGE
jgi:uncharacterized membrane protein YeaQ/YmgE (transglycosylase-associated protein family)